MIIIIIIIIITIISWVLCKRLRGRLVSGRHGGRSRFSRSRPFVLPFEAFICIFFAISLLVYQLFRQMNGYCIRPSCLAAFSPARILILAVPLASFSGRHLGFIKYHQSRVPLYGAPTACMTMQLVRHSSLELLIHSGGVQLNPGPDTGSNPVTSYGRRFVSGQCKTQTADCRLQTADQG